ncbi:M23 family metallopeptidase [Lysobacter soli]|uniref:M23 family metallopeptidase n=1 Tax=Lysobacter soli TaxID=453783 RepID=UPI002410156E|nr:M23 family metallopeptidase [Lysobacter soli]MDG2518423.1 M23 family metallopeptidase [Lysobacter soli]
MSKAALLFLAIVLVGANVAIYHFGREHGAASPAVVAQRPSAVVATNAASPAPTPVQKPAASAPSAPATTDTRATRPVVTASIAAGEGTLTIPVQGVTSAQLRDTFSEARSQGRVHEALDIMAPRGTPVLAVADGTVEKLFTSVPGGLTIYQFEPSGRYAYYYAHLDRYADGLQEKQAIRRGEVIGYVGSTGNADPSAPHLHFAIFELGPERQWWKGTAINPYPVFTRPQ